MIYDKLSNYKKYIAIHELFEEAFNYLTNTDFSTIPPGRYPLNNVNIFALVQEFVPKLEKDCILEGHEMYIDIQYIFLGEEYIGHKILYQQTPNAGHYENDLAFYNDSSENIKVKEGEFIIFFPEDLHKPCIAAADCSFVKKIVVKVKL